MKNIKELDQFRSPLNVQLLDMKTKHLFYYALVIHGISFVNSSKNGLAQIPPMGWLSWVRFMCETDCIKHPDGCINEKLYKEMADAIVDEGYLEAGYNYLNVDDCWSEKERDNVTLQMVPHKERFPHGIKALAKYAHDRGLKLGLYSDIGTKTCQGYPGHVNEPGNTPSDFFELDAKTFLSWDIDSLKVDGCHMKPEDMDPLYVKLGDALQAQRRPIVYYCSGPFFQARWGTPKYPAEKVNFNLYRRHCNGWRFFDDIADSWQSVLEIIDFLSSNWQVYEKYHGPGGWFDPDMLIIGNKGLNVEQSKAQMAIWSIMAAPLLMSNDLRDIGEEYKKILQNKDVIAVNQDPLGFMGTPVINEGKEASVWVKTLSNPKVSFAVVYFNRGTESREMSYSFPEMGNQSLLSNNVTIKAYDLFDSMKSIGTFNYDQKIRLTVPATGVRMFKLIFEV
jgi:hypothetical protein